MISHIIIGVGVYVSVSYPVSVSVSVLHCSERNQMHCKFLFCIYFSLHHPASKNKSLNTKTCVVVVARWIIVSYRKYHILQDMQESNVLNCLWFNESNTDSISFSNFSLDSVHSFPCYFICFSIIDKKLRLLLFSPYCILTHHVKFSKKPPGFGFSD